MKERKQIEKNKKVNSDSSAGRATKAESNLRAFPNTPKQVWFRRHIARRILSFRACRFHNNFHQVATNNAYLEVTLQRTLAFSLCSPIAFDRAMGYWWVLENGYGPYRWVCVASESATLTQSEPQLPYSLSESVLRLRGSFQLMIFRLLLDFLENILSENFFIYRHTRILATGYIATHGFGPRML